MNRDLRLESILKSANIKIEPVEEHQELISPRLFESTLLPAAPPWEYHPNPIEIKQEPNAVSTTMELEDTDYLSIRTDDRQQRLTRNNEQFVVHLPQRFEVPIPDSDASPLTISAHNAIYSFQATSNNVTLNSNVPFNAQQNARRIGADPPRHSSRDPRLLNKSVLTNNIQEPQINTSSSPQSSASPIILRKETKDAETQTSKNTGTLYVELTENRLRNLSYDEKELLRKFKEVRICFYFAFLTSIY